MRGVLEHLQRRVQVLDELAVFVVECLNTSSLSPTKMFTLTLVGSSSRSITPWNLEADAMPRPGRIHGLKPGASRENMAFFIPAIGDAVRYSSTSPVSRRSFQRMPSAPSATRPPTLWAAMRRELWWAYLRPPRRRRRSARVRPKQSSRAVLPLAAADQALHGRALGRSMSRSRRRLCVDAHTAQACADRRV
jgi:hypothetical protein